MKRLFIILIIIICIAPVLTQCEKRENIDDSKEIQWTTYTTLDGLLDNEVLSIAIDKEGNKWFGTVLGVSKFDGTTWTNYTTRDGLVSYYVQAIAIDKEGNKWFGAWEGVSKFDGTTWTNYSTKDGLVSNNVHAIAIDKDGSKWFGTDQGVSKFDGTTWTNYTTKNGLAHNYVTAIAINQYGYKWFATWRGVTMFTGINWRSHQYWGVKSDDVKSIAIDPQNNIWIGTVSYNFSNQISVFDGRIWTDYQVFDSWYSEVNSIAIDEQSNKWIAEIHQIPDEEPLWGPTWEGGGVLKFAGNTKTFYSTSDGLVSNFVNVIVIDKEGNKWFGTDKGVSKLSD